MLPHPSKNAETRVKSRGVFFGWYIIVVVGVGLLVSYGPFVAYNFSVFLKPIGQDLGWGRARISLALSLSLAAMSLSSALVGRLLDRFGARRVILPASALLGVGLMSFTFIGTRPVFFYAAYIILGIAGSATGLVAYLKVIADWFDRRRGLALGLAMIGIGTGSMILPPISQALVSSIGWRNAYAVLGVAVIVVTLPVVGLFLKDKPAMIGLLPDGGAKSQDSQEKQGVTGRQALRTGVFWTMSAAFFLVAVSVSGCLAHLVPLLTDRGASARSAAGAASMLGVATLAGRIGTGYLLDRLLAPRLAACYFCGAALGLMLLWLGLSGPYALAAAFLVGLANGAEGDIIAYLVSRYFGLRSFGEIFGYVFAIYVTGGVVGPLAMGIGFDLALSYGPAIVLLSAASIVGALLMMRLGPVKPVE
jgi:MFS family permease